MKFFSYQFFNVFFLRASLIEKQKKLYFHRSKLMRDNELRASDSCDDIEEPKISIKTELEESVENIFVDCAAMLSTNDVKQEFDDPPALERPKPGRRKKFEMNTDEEHQNFFKEFKKVLKQNKNK